jgi:polar amino acid transport system substrate-binding protein
MEGSAMDRLFWPWARLLPLGLVLSLFAATAQAQDLHAIKQRGTVNVGTQADYPPFEFIQDGKIVGYDEDLLNLVVSSWGVKLNQLDLPFAGLLTGLTQSKYDLICTALLILPGRGDVVSMTLPVAVARVGFYKRKGDTKVKSIDDLTGVTIGAVVPPSGPTAMMTAWNDNLKKIGKGAADIKYFQGSTDLALALLNGQVDVWTTTNLTMLAQMKKYPDKFELVASFGDPYYYAWAARARNTSLRDSIDIELRKIRDSGKMKELQQKWFGLTMDLPDSGYLPPDGK